MGEYQLAGLKSSKSIKWKEGDRFKVAFYNDFDFFIFGDKNLMDDAAQAVIELKEGSELSKNEEIRVSALQDPILESLIESFKKMGYSLQDEDYLTERYEMWFRKKEVKEVKVPEKFLVGSLRECDVNLVDKNWQYGGSDRTKRAILDCIKERPSVCIFDNNEPIAWAVIRHDWSIGMVFVLENYRKMGLGSLLLNTLSEKVVSFGKKPYTIVSADNESSKLMHLKLGFERSDYRVHWITFEKQKK